MRGGVGTERRARNVNLLKGEQQGVSIGGEMGAVTIAGSIDKPFYFYGL